MKIRTLFIQALSALVLALVLFQSAPAAADGYMDPGPTDTPEYLYYIEGTGSYYLPGGEADIFYNLGRWYRRSGDSWSMSEELYGPWSGIIADSLPEDLAGLPDDFAATRRLGMIPYRYVTGPQEQDDPYYVRYYRVEYYDDYDRRGYHRRWHPHGKFWFFVAPDLDDDDWEDSHRRRKERRY